MLQIVVVMPAYNAAKTLERTYNEIPKDVVDEVSLINDASRDDTAVKAGELGIHPENRGYGGNQKTCYEGSWICEVIPVPESGNIHR